MSTYTSLPAGSTANADGSFTILVGNFAYGPGQIGVRLKAQGTTPAGATFYNDATQTFTINSQGQEITVPYTDNTNTNPGGRITFTPTWDYSGGGGVPAYGQVPGLDFYAGFNVTKGLRFNCDHVSFVGNTMKLYVDDVFLKDIVMPAVGQEAFRVAYTDGATRYFKLRAAVQSKPVGFQNLYLSI